MFGTLEALSQGNCIFERLTNDPDESSRMPVISPDGSCLVFESSSNLTGQNPQGNQQIFTYNIPAIFRTEPSNR